MTPKEADKAWFDYCFEFKDGPYTAILEFKKALRREIEKQLKSALDMSAFAQGHGDYVGTLVWDKVIENLRSVLHNLDTVWRHLLAQTVSRNPHNP